MLPTHHRPPALLCGLLCLVLLVLVADREGEEESGPSEASLITMFQDNNFLLTLLSSEQYFF